MAERRSSEEVQRLTERAMERISRDRARQARQERDVRRQERSLVLGVIALAVLLPTLLLLTALNLSGYGPFRIDVPELTQAARMQQLHEAMSYAARELEAVRRRTGSYPVDLEPLAVADPAAWEYRRLRPDRYHLRLVRDELSLEYDSRLDADRVFAEIRGPGEP